MPFDLNDRKTRRTLLLTGALFLCLILLIALIVNLSRRGAEDTGSAESGPTAVIPAGPVSEDSDTPAPTQAPEEEQENSGAVSYVTTTVNVRTEPNTDCEVLGKLTAGSAVFIKGTDGDWTVIDYNGSTAYISSEYLLPERQIRNDWNLSELSNEETGFGYARANRDENNVPTDWVYFAARWGEFNADWIQDTTKNTIYLTMDEGFGNDYTITILDTLKEKNVNVTFFLTKYFLDERPELVQRMLDEGHQLGNHTCTHPAMPELSLEDQTNQILTVNNIVKDQFGYDIRLFRYPQGKFSAQSLGLVNNLGMKAVFWSFAYGDYDPDNQPDVGESLDLALDCLHNGAIYLLHANSSTNTAMLADFIDGARARGYEFGVYPLD